MPARRIFVLLMATIVVGRTLHCCYTNAVLCGGGQQVDGASGEPLRDPADMDPNETGCICKGAVVNVPSVLAALRTSADELNPLAASLQPADGASAASQPRDLPGDRQLLGPPPLGGRALRAWLGSLLV
jgi:hypothetical protein